LIRFDNGRAQLELAQFFESWLMNPYLQKQWELISRWQTITCALSVNLNLKPSCICFEIVRMFNNIGINSSPKTIGLNSLALVYMLGSNETSQLRKLELVTSIDLLSLACQFGLFARIIIA
jgi:hypothetical protein